MSEQDPKVIIPEMMNQAQNGLQQFLSRFQQELGRMYQYLQHMDQKMMLMSVELMTAGAHIQMLQNIFIEQGTYTKEEIQEMYTEQVANPIKKHIQELQAQRDAQIKQAQAAAQDQQEEPAEEAEEEVEENTDSDVVLPSEKHNVVKFK